MSKNGKMMEFENLNPNSVVVVIGPTASGKSALALGLAAKYNGVIINADASQIYKGVPIVTAVPSEADKTKVEHRLYEILDPWEKGSVSEWVRLATAEIKNTWRNNKLPVVVGGTGFYVESLIVGVSPIPETGAKAKEKVAELLAKEGTKGLFAKLTELDPAGGRMVKPNDVTRARRALEIFLDTGKSIAEWFKMPMIKPLPEADFRVLAVLPKLQDLEKKCAARFDWMMENGALDEVKKLLELNLDENQPVMKAIGVPELKSFLQGKTTLEEAVKLAKLHTRQYAKRQLTWFRNRLKNLEGAEVSIINEI